MFFRNIEVVFNFIFKLFYLEHKSMELINFNMIS